ncbi:hypothetical protein ACFQLX_25540, partial [Streptomyces polyrhachis]
MTFAQAQESAGKWVNAGVPAHEQREVRVREFDLGFVAWAEDREDGARSEGGRQRLVIARDSGETTLWPGLAVGEVIRRYEEEYGARAAGAPAAKPGQRIDLEATSFLLTPPEWLQEAADSLGVGAPLAPQGGAGAPSAPPAPPAPSAPSVSPPPPPSASNSGAPAPSLPPPAPTMPYVPGPAGAAAAPPSPGGSPWTAAHARGGEGGAVVPPATVFAPPLSGSDDDDAPAPPPGVRPEAQTARMPQGNPPPPPAPGIPSPPP